MLLGLTLGASAEGGGNSFNDTLGALGGRPYTREGRQTLQNPRGVHLFWAGLMGT